MDQYKIVASWTQSLLKDMSDDICSIKALPHKIYSNQYVIFKDKYAKSPDAFKLPTLKQVMTTDKPTISYVDTTYISRSQSIPAL